MPCKVAGESPVGTKADGRLHITEWIPVKDVKKMDRVIDFALVAGDRGGGGLRLVCPPPRTNSSAPPAS